MKETLECPSWFFEALLKSDLAEQLVDGNGKTLADRRDENLKPIQGDFFEEYSCVVCHTNHTHPDNQSDYGIRLPCGCDFCFEDYQVEIYDKQSGPDIMTITYPSSSDSDSEAEESEAEESEEFRYFCPNCHQKFDEDDCQIIREYRK